MVKKLNRCKGLRTAACGFTLMELLLVVIVVFCLIGILWPIHLHNRARTTHVACELNLKQIGIAFRTWDGDYNNLYPMRYFTNTDGSAKYADGSNVFRYFRVMSDELNDPRVLICPSDVREPASNFGHLKNQNVSYFVGLQADETLPNMLLSGDRNLVTNGVDVVPGLAVIKTGENVDWSAKMHNRSGIFLLADGRVENGLGRTFQMYLSRTGTNVTRLAVP